MSFFSSGSMGSMSRVQTEEECFWYLNLDEAQQEGLKKFREHLTAEKLLHDGLDDDPTLLRFLKARQWHLEPATLMYKNMLDWRKQEGVDTLYESYEYPELLEVLPVYPHFYHKLDKYGRPVYIELLGQTDCSKILEHTTMERILRYHVWTWERFTRKLLPACSQLAGKPVITATVIVDLAGLSLMRHFTHAARSLLTTIAKLDQDNYPEHMGCMLIINAPSFFRLIWAVVNPLLEERTRRKIMVLGGDYLSTLKQLIPEENIPTIFGGTSVVPDHYTSVGPWQAVEPCKSAHWLPKGARPSEPGPAEVSKAPADVAGAGHEVMVRAE